MSEEEHLTRRLEELQGACAELDLLRGKAEEPLRAGFAPELAVLEERIARLEGTLAETTRRVLENERQREGHERARLFAVWRTARGAFAWMVALGASVYLLKLGTPWLWLALVPPGLTLLGGWLLTRLGRGRS